MMTVCIVQAEEYVARAGVSCDMVYELTFNMLGFRGIPNYTKTSLLNYKWL
jgi:hypothetical protein